MRRERYGGGNRPLMGESGSSEQQTCSARQAPQRLARHFLENSDDPSAASSDEYVCSTKVCQIRQRVTPVRHSQQPPQYIPIGDSLRTKKPRAIRAGRRVKGQQGKLSGCFPPLLDGLQLLAVLLRVGHDLALRQAVDPLIVRRVSAFPASADGSGAAGWWDACPESVVSSRCRSSR